MKDPEELSSKSLIVFSDISSKDLQYLESKWKDIPSLHKIALLTGLDKIMEENTLVSCDTVGKFALDDGDPIVKIHAMKLLQECDNTNLIPIFINYLNNDSHPEVQAAAATALGRFILLGELEEIPHKKSHPAFQALLNLATDSENNTIRRKAIESLGYSSNHQVQKLIQEAFALDDPLWKASALYAMGRSLDTHWEKEITEKINDPIPEIQIEAIRAAGEIELQQISPLLLEMLEDGIYEDRIKHQIYWALSKMGGNGVREKLESDLNDTDDSEEIEILEMALENLDFTEDIDTLDLFDE